jgi:hypothetical protein
VVGILGDIQYTIDEKFKKDSSGHISIDIKSYWSANVAWMLKRTFHNDKKDTNILIAI